MEPIFGGGSAVLFALRDHGPNATYAWPRMIDIDFGRAAVATGLALRESGGRTTRVYAIREDGSLLWQHTLGGLLEWAQPVLGPAGDLYVADTRRCVWIESGLCNAFDVNPRIDAILNDAPRRRAARH